MTFPTSYKKESQQYSDWNSGSKVRDIQTELPRPANDNLPDPANDNISDIVPKELQNKISSRTIANAGRFALRRILPKLNPYLDAISIGVQIGELINDVYFPIVTPGSPGGGSPSLDFTGWDWLGSPYNYPPTRPGWVRWQATDFFGIQYKPTIEELDGHAATPADNAIDFLGSVYWAGGDAEYMLRSPDIWSTVGVVDPWVTEGIAPSVVWVTVPGIALDPVIRENELRLSESGEDEQVERDPYEWLGRTRRNVWAIGAGIALNPDGSISNAPANLPLTHSSTKPPPNTKEKKYIANARGTVAVIFGALTETSDLVDALWDALPKSRKYGFYKLHGKGGVVYWKRRHGASMVRKMLDLYHGIEEIDMNKAIWNAATNEIQDHLIGKLGKAGQRAQKPWLDHIGRPVGLGTGPAI